MYIYIVVWFREGAKVCVIQNIQTINKVHPASCLMAPEAVAPTVGEPGVKLTTHVHQQGENPC